MRLITYKKHLNFFIFLSLLLGISLGFYSEAISSFLVIFGELFLRALKLMILPVIFFSMLSGILKLKGESQLGKLGIQTIIFYFLTTAVAVITGLILVNIIEPGKSLNLSVSNLEISKSNLSLKDILYNFIPENIISAGASGNILGIIFFTIFFGIALLKVSSEKIAPMIETINSAVSWMIDIIMLFAPLGILSLIASVTSDFVSNGSLSKLGPELFTYVLTVVLGLLFHGVATLSVLLLLFKVNPINFFKHMTPAISTAFSTASSAATLPLTIDCLVDRAKIKRKFASFVPPLGATVNMDGTALYESVAAIFIANAYGINLGFSEQITIFLTATFSAIGAAGIPGAGIVMMTLVLSSVGLPAEGLSLIIGIDRILDMFRTAINVWGDSVGTAIVSAVNKKSD